MKLNIPYILTINGGSSSIKFSLFLAEQPPRQIVTGKIDRIGVSNTTINIKNHEVPEKNLVRSISASNYLSAIHALMDWIEREEVPLLIAVGHRIVHGGPKYHQPEKITPAMLAELTHYSSFSPAHLPNEILLIDAFQKKFPHLLQIACFDTAFHHHMPRVAKMLPIPRRYAEKGVQRYGFHGISCAFLMEELERKVGRTKAQEKIILVHLGNGVSLTAVYQGKSMDTSMSFTPAAGVPMGTRSGDLDPALAWYFMREEKMNAEEFNEMINTQSGLLGVSEISSDIRDLLACEATDSRAFEAIELFCYQIKKWIGAFSAVLGGLDIVVFSGGIGENQVSIRARICAGLEFLGIVLDDQYNADNNTIISAPTSKVAVHVIHTNEEQMIAQAVYCQLKL